MSARAMRPSPGSLAGLSRRSTRWVRQRATSARTPWNVRRHGAVANRGRTARRGRLARGLDGIRPRLASTVRTATAEAAHCRAADVKLRHAAVRVGDASILLWRKRSGWFGGGGGESTVLGRRWDGTSGRGDGTRVEAWRACVRAAMGARSRTKDSPPEPSQSTQSHRDPMDARGSTKSYARLAKLRSGTGRARQPF
jgi:hypothetical protein